MNTLWYPMNRENDHLLEANPHLWWNSMEQCIQECELAR